MTMLLDSRVGSKELLPYFSSYDVPVELTTLDFGDACWSGQGVYGPILIGVERKVISDLVASMRSNRLSGHQLPGLIQSYHFVYLIVEGIVRCARTGEMEVLRGHTWVPVRVGSKPILYREVDHYLATLEHLCGLTVVFTNDEARTVAYLVSRYKWWQKDWVKHDSHQVIYSPDLSRMGNGHGHKPVFRTSGPVEEVAARFPGVDRKAWAFGKSFKSVHEMVNAERDRLLEVDGVGKVMAERIYKWVRGE